MATVDELIKRANFMVSDAIKNDIALLFFNECLEELSNSAKLTKTVEIPLNENEKTFDLPSDHIETVRITLLKDNREIPVRNQNDDAEYQYRELEKEVTIHPTISRPTTVRVDYYALLPSLPESDMTAIPSIPVHFHKLLPLYLAIRYYENWEGDPQARQHFENLYQQARLEFTVEMNKKELKTKRKQVQKFVSWE